MVVLKAKEICPKSNTCKFASLEGEQCYGCCDRDSTFVCDLDFATEEVDFTQPSFACAV